ncbi:hypothetical protein D3C85_1857840 [compost metagenome]
MGVKQPISVSTTRDFNVPLPKKLSRMLDLMRPGFRPKKLACGYRLAASITSISLPATVFICTGIAL